MLYIFFHTVYLVISQIDYDDTSDDMCISQQKVEREATADGMTGAKN